MTTIDNQGGPVPFGRSRNCRDVGGHVTAEGLRVRRGLLYRSDLPVLDEEDRAELDALALATVIDLREAEERDLRPSSAEGKVRRVMPIPLGLGPLVAADPAKAASLRELYRAMVLELGVPIAEVVSELCRPGALPALVHCAAGKDRTGVVIGLVLSALGVADSDVAADYAATADNLTPAFFAYLNADGHNARVDLTSLTGSDVGEMLRVLALVREVAGDACSYLTDHGVAPEDLDRLRALLLGSD
ncbi:tyrosine-protein phosphatase [Nocardioides immobilis]|uniref:Tyrosine-protein phosphatase n=1 Tax=Nocardioides immobilis TaxID=2049295 RepID=A0A417Y642_9ACTN|nr:tyrosine-protein phosphatase [Nocardioides immobilis]RHW28119.1 tyrosine-protein phosphatase [Nocardioides immobilis]